MKRYFGWILAILICVTIGVVGNKLYSLRFSEYSFSGNTLRYSDEELKQYIFSTELENNPIYYMLFGDKDKLIPFVAKYDVDITLPDKVNVTVYGKNVIGYVYYKDFYFYFDSDGIVVECSSEFVEDAILIEGLEFGQMVLYQALPIEKESTFKTILSLTKMIKKNEIKVDKIVFDNELNITLIVEGIEVLLGQDEYLDEKIIKVKDLLPSIAGYSGILNMENFREGTDNFWFRTGQ